VVGSGVPNAGSGAVGGKQPARSASRRGCGGRAGVGGARAGFLAHEGGGLAARAAARGRGGASLLESDGGGHARQRRGRASRGGGESSVKGKSAWHSAVGRRGEGLVIGVR